MANFMKKGKPAKPVAKRPKKIMKASEEPIKEHEVVEEPIVEEIPPVVAEEPVEEAVTEEPTEEVAVEEPKEIKVEPIPEEIEEEPVEPEEVKEEPKTKKTKKKTTKKEEKVAETVENLEEIELVVSEITTPTSEAWEKEKEDIRGRMSQVVLNEDLDPTSIKVLLSDISALNHDLCEKLSQAKADYENLNEMIEYIEKQNASGANAEERKRNAVMAVTHYKKTEDSEPIDLLLYLRFKRDVYYFYDAQMKVLDKDQKMLITFSSAFKLELGCTY